MKKQVSQLRAGAFLSYINLGISSIIPFVYTPIMLRMLGQAEYGLYSLASSVVSYLSLLSFGFGSTIIRYIAKCRAEEDKETEEKVYGFFILLYCVLAIVVFGVGGIIANKVEPIFHKGLSECELERTKTLVYVMTFNCAISFPNSVFSSMITAHEKYIYRKLVDMLSTVAAPIANLVALYLGYASVGMALAGTILQFLMLPLNLVYCSKKLDLNPQFAILPKKLIREMLGFSFFVFIGSLVDMLFWATDKVIIGMLCGSVAVAIYNVGATFNNTVMNLSTSISGVLMPKITGMAVKDAPKEQWTELFVRVGRIQFVIIALIVSGFSVFGKRFIILWAGAEYQEAYWVAILTLFPLCIPLIQNTGLNIIIAQNKHQFRSIVYLIIAIINVVSTYIVVPIMGIIGAALCSCVSYLLGQGLIMNIYYYKVTGIDILLFWRNILKMGIWPGSLMVFGLILNQYYTIDNWFVFLVCVIIFSVVYAILMYLFALNGYEKDIIREPVKKIVNKLSKK